MTQVTKQWDSAAFERCVDVMAGLRPKYGCQVLERHKDAGKAQDAAHNNEPIQYYHVYNGRWVDED